MTAVGGDPDVTAAGGDPAESVPGGPSDGDGGSRLAGMARSPLGRLVARTPPFPGGLGFVPVVVEGRSALDGVVDDGTVPRAVRFTLLTRRRARTREDDEVLTCSAGGEALYAMDDGNDHVAVARVVGAGGGATYCLVGRTDALAFGSIRSGEVPATAAFDDARGIALCAVADDATNVVVVDTYRNVSQVPPGYLPGSPPVAFDEGP